MDGLRLRREGGFTLIELLVAIAIIGILVAIAIPQFGAYRRRGFDAQVRTSVRNLVTAQEAYFVDSDTYGTGAGNTAQFTTRGFKQSSSVDITTTGTAVDFTITGTAVSGCSPGTGVWIFDSSGGMTTGTECN